MIAIPWEQFRLKRSEDKLTFVAPIGTEALENAPEVNLAVWPENSVTGWDSEVFGYWENQVD